MWIVRWRFAFGNDRGNEMLYGMFKTKSEAKIWANNTIDDLDTNKIEYVNNKEF